MKKDFRKVIAAMDTDIQAIPAKIRGAVQNFQQENGFDIIELKEYCGNWDGYRYNSAVLYIHKDFVQKFKNENPALF